MLRRHREPNKWNAKKNQKQKIVLFFFDKDTNKQKNKLTTTTTTPINLWARLRMGHTKNEGFSLLLLFFDFYFCFNLKYLYIHRLSGHASTWIDGPFWASFFLVEDSMIRFDVLFSIGFCLKMMRSLKCFF